MRRSESAFAKPPRDTIPEALSSRSIGARSDARSSARCANVVHPACRALRELAPAVAPELNATLLGRCQRSLRPSGDHSAFFVRHHRHDPDGEAVPSVPRRSLPSWLREGAIGMSAVATDHKMLKIARGERLRQEVGDYYVIDFRKNYVVATRVDPEQMARELGALDPADLFPVLRSISLNKARGRGSLTIHREIGNCLIHP
jgi:hypothetical protein